MMPPQDVFAHCDLCVASFEIVDAYILLRQQSTLLLFPTKAATYTTDNLDNHDIRINRIRARSLVRHRHESCKHGELEERVDGTHIGHFCRV